MNTFRIDLPTFFSIACGLATFACNALAVVGG